MGIKLTGIFTPDETILGGEVRYQQQQRQEQRTNSDNASAIRVVCDVLFVCKIIRDYPYKYKSEYANANISIGEAALILGGLATQITEQGLLSAMLNVYKCTSIDSFPLRHVISLAEREAFLVWRKSYQDAVKEHIENIQNDMLRTGLLELLSFYFSKDSNSALMFEDGIHVMAEYLRMHPIGSAQFASQHK